jgi:prepilin signal peptidase PulO-like enzyme (type II secretory pathway)
MYLILVLLGLCFGSFVGASVWRLRARQLKEDKELGEHVDKIEYNRLEKLTKHMLSSDRSMCLSCGYTLKWYDMIPLISWLFLGGKCRKCHKKIGNLEPLVELGVALFFVLSFMFWPYPLQNGLQIARLVIWLVAGVPLAILFVYDAKWFILDRTINNIVVVLGLCSSTILLISSSFSMISVTDIAGSVLILGGLYYVLFKVSGGKWVGGGDPLLGLGLGLLLADWKLAFIALFAANLVGTLLVLPGMLTGKLKRDSHVPFGPLLIIGFVIAGLAGSWLLSLFFYTVV